MIKFLSVTGYWVNVVEYQVLDKLLSTVSSMENFAEPKSFKCRNKLLSKNILISFSV